MFERSCPNGLSIGSDWVDNNPISFVLSMPLPAGKLEVKFGRAAAFSLPKERHRPYQWNDGAQTVPEAVPKA